METKIEKVKSKRAGYSIEHQRGIKQNTLSFLPRKRECVKMLDSYLKSGAKVVPFDENGNVLGDYLLQFNNLKICYLR